MNLSSFLDQLRFGFPPPAAEQEIEPWTRNATENVRILDERMKRAEDSRKEEEQ